MLTMKTNPVQFTEACVHYLWFDNWVDSSQATFHKRHTWVALRRCLCCFGVNLFV